MEGRKATLSRGEKSSGESYHRSGALGIANGIDGSYFAYGGSTIVAVFPQGIVQYVISVH
jgi:hypothetical protein